MNIAFNIINYQIIWFLAVYWGNSGAAIACVLLLIHLLISPCRGKDLRVMLFAWFLGLVVDGSLQQVGFFSLKEDGIGIPYWLMVVWLGFATTPNHSLAWLRHRLILSAIFGAVGGPAAYYGGARLGAATFHQPLIISIIVLILVWGLVFPAIMLYSSGGRHASDAESS
jgi:hypothetical protein